MLYKWQFFGQKTGADSTELPSTGVAPFQDRESVYDYLTGKTRSYNEKKDRRSSRSRSRERSNNRGRRSRSRSVEILNRGRRSRSRERSRGRRSRSRSRERDSFKHSDPSSWTGKGFKVDNIFGY